MRRLIAVLWVMYLSTLLVATAFGYYIADNQQHEADPSVWRCVQYVPGSADCAVLQRR